MDIPILGGQVGHRLLVPQPQYRSLNVSEAAGAVYAANDAVFVPFELDSQQQINEILFIVAVSSGNIDAGIYTRGGVRIVSAGTTAMAAAGLQTLNITDTILGRGKYLAAFAISNLTGTIQECTPFGGASAAAVALGGALKMATAFPLPATATLVTPTRTTLPILGLGFQ